MNDPAHPWVESALRSLDAAEILYGAERWPQTCFHAQHCAELLLKAAIVHRGVVPPRVHGIMELLSHLDPSHQEALELLASGLQDLDRYYAPTRYPDAVVGSLPSKQEATEALAVAREVAAVIDGVLHRGC